MDYISINGKRAACLIAALVCAMVALSATVAAADVFRGTGGDDRLRGTDKNDTLKGLAGNDRLHGRGGNDLLKGARGNDDLRGYKGNDRFFGGTGNDVAYAASGDDDMIMDLDAGVDHVYCGSGYDTARLDAHDFIGDPEGQQDVAARGLLGNTMPMLNAVLSCEKITVNGTVVVEVPRL